MIFGKIDYINLLPFLVFMKRFLRHSSERYSFFNKVGVPSKVNKDFRLGRVDAAFISSIRSRGKKGTTAGVVAFKEVRSVFVLPGEKFKKDKASETSNALARVLKQKGEVIIGDEGLREFYRNQGALDLARLWYEKTSLPFVFARLCSSKDHAKIAHIADKFTAKKTKIPHYILKKYAQKTKISEAKIIDYLHYIRYKIGKKEELALKKFFASAKKLNI